MTADGRKAGSRRLIGAVMAAASGLTVLVAVLVFLGVVPVAEPSRVLVGGVLAAVGIVDLLIALYFVLSEPS